MGTGQASHVRPTGAPGKPFFLHLALGAMQSYRKDQALKEEVRAARAAASG